MQIASFNINGINGRLPGLLHWLERAQPDAVCLQELKTPDARFPIKEIERYGYGAIWHGQKSWIGVAILAKGCDPTSINWSAGGTMPFSGARCARPSRTF